MIGAGAAALAAAVLGYGAWQAHRRADVWLLVNDHAGRTPQRLWSELTDAQVSIRDAAGREIAQATLEPPQGLPRWIGPGAQAVHCDPHLARDAWQRCWPAQAAWMARWAPLAHHARVSVGRCVVDPVPVQRRVHSDWWLWWVPLPHVGGTPITHYTLALHLDSAACAPATAP